MYIDRLQGFFQYICMCVRALRFNTSLTGLCQRFLRPPLSASLIATLRVGQFVSLTIRTTAGSQLESAPHMSSSLSFLLISEFPSPLSLELSH